MYAFVASLLLSAAPAEAAFPPCISVSAFARYGAYGYDHIVTIDNGCEQVAACVVATDVSPSSIEVSVAPKTRESVVTFRGSPASRFSARVRCQPMPERSHSPRAS